MAETHCSEDDEGRQPRSFTKDLGFFNDQRTIARKLCKTSGR